MVSATYIIGDIHGQYRKLVNLLKESRLIDGQLGWQGGNATLWFMGDFFDRGSQGIESVDLVMRLQNEAEVAGGKVNALLGNHDALILAAHLFPNHPTTGSSGTFRADWQRNGGDIGDLVRLTQPHVDWIINLPAMTKIGETLLVHADAPLYYEYGKDMDSVNWSFFQLLHSNDGKAWDRLCEVFSTHYYFWEDPQRARKFLATYGGKRLIHGHSPIEKMTAQPSEDVTEAFVYADGLCINVDAGLYRNSRGFVYQLQEPA